MIEGVDGEGAEVVDGGRRAASASGERSVRGEAGERPRPSGGESG